MTNKNNDRVQPAQNPQPAGAKKAYHTPALTVHGRVDEITKVLLAISPH